VLRGSSCLLVYEIPLASVAARYGLLCFLRKLSGCMRNITAFCQHLLRPIKSTVLADTDVSMKLKYWPDISATLGRHIGLSLERTTSYDEEGNAPQKVVLLFQSIIMDLEPGLVDKYSQLCSVCSQSNFLLSKSLQAGTEVPKWGDCNGVASLHPSVLPRS